MAGHLLINPIFQHMNIQTVLDEEKLVAELKKLENHTHYRQEVRCTFKKKDYNPSKYHWPLGTGFGHNGLTEWDLNGFLKLQNEIDGEIKQVLDYVKQVISNTELDQMPVLFKIVQDSYLEKFLKFQLYGINFIEISHHLELYLSIFSLLEKFITPQGVFIFANLETPNLYEILRELEKDAQSMKKYLIRTDDQEIVEIIIQIYNCITPLYLSFCDQRETDKVTYQSTQEMKYHISAKRNDIKQDYVQVMTQYRFQDQCHFFQQGFHYKNITVESKVIRALAREFASLARNLPVHFDSSIFVRIDEQINYIRALITGPDQTPYDSGVFIFDVICGESYPNEPPKVNFNNSSGVRQSPIMYGGGKVCLSLLNNWPAYKSEMWNKLSNLQQVFLAIQSQILIGSPYWNEPGHENCPELQNVHYRQYCQYYTMRYCMVDVIRDIKNGKYPEFKEVVLNHFRLKKQYILERSREWCERALNLRCGPQQYHKLLKSDMEKTREELVHELNTF